MINLSGLADDIFFPGDNSAALQDAAIKWYKANNIGSITIGWQIPIDPVTGAIAAYAANPAFPGKQFVGTSLADIQAFALEASASGLQVVLKPYFINASNASNIGAPSSANENLAAITATMGAYLPQLATVAQLAHATAIILGTENTNLQTSSYTAWWQGVIQAVRHNYSGLLGYAATYFPFISAYVDNFPDVHQIPFASALDFVGADVYLPVLASGSATYDQAVAAWTQNLKSLWPNSVPNAPATLNILADLAAVAAAYGKPLVLTETGYPSSTLASSSPANVGGTPDPAEQALLARAEFDVLKTLGTWFAGAIWFGGNPSDFASYYNPATSLGWDVVGQPVAKILADYVAAVGNGVAAQATLTPPALSTKVLGGGYDVLVAPSSLASSAATLTSTHDGAFTLAARSGAFSDTVSGVMQVVFADKTLTVAAANSSGESVALLYQATLGRAPDAPGLAYWQKVVSSLSPTQATAALAPSFTHSAEFVAKYGTLTDAQFVNQMYVNVLDRAPDTAGLNYWVATMTAGLTREQMLTAFAVSQEATDNATAGFVGQSGAHPAWLYLI